MNKVVITIARQYGSGGRTIGEMLAKELGIAYYDKELLKKASEDSGIHERLFAQIDEKKKRRFPWHKPKEESLVSPDRQDYTSETNLFMYQAKIIREIAERESCVIIGRCADYILREREDVLSVFIHAPEEFCLEQALLKHDLPVGEVKKLIHKIDKERADYYEYHTGREWTDARNYDLCLDSSKLGFQRCVEEIKAYIDVRLK